MSISNVFVKGNVSSEIGSISNVTANIITGGSNLIKDMTIATIKVTVTNSNRCQNY